MVLCTLLVPTVNPSCVGFGNCFLASVLQRGILPGIRPESHISLGYGMVRWYTMNYNTLSSLSIFIAWLSYSTTRGGSSIAGITVTSPGRGVTSSTRLLSGPCVLVRPLDSWQAAGRLVDARWFISGSLVREEDVTVFFSALQEELAVIHTALAALWGLNFLVQNSSRWEIF